MKNFLFFLLICFATETYAQFSRPAIKNITPTNVTCNGQASGSIIIIASNGRPPYGYSINGGLSFQSSNSFTNLTAGTYTIIVKDTFNSRSDSQKIQITQPSKLTLNCSGNIQCSGNSGTVSVNVSGGVPPYSYSWNAGTQTTSATQTGLPAGVYVVRVFDAHQCSDTCSIILTQPQGSLTPKYRIGDSISCGYIFYVDTSTNPDHPCSTHYLVCAYTDQNNSVTWYNNQSAYAVTGATNDVLFDRANAIQIDSFSLAASTCSNYTTDSCKRWYLPSKTELSFMYTNLAAKQIGNFAKEGYWSSIEGSKKHDAWIIDFLNGRQIQNDKSNKYHVRAVCEVWLKN